MPAGLSQAKWDTGGASVLPQRPGLYMQWAWESLPAAAGTGWGPIDFEERVLEGPGCQASARAGGEEAVALPLFCLHTQVV